MAQNRRGQGVTGVQPWLFEVLQNVLQRGQADADLFGNVGPGALFAITVARFVASRSQAALQLDELAELGNAFGWLAGRAISCREHLQQSTRRFVALRVNE